MRKIEGLNVWPLAVESVVFEHDAVADYQVVLSSADGGQDVATLWVEPAQHLKTADVHALSECLAGAVERRVGIRFEIEIVDPETVARDDWKAKRWIDRLPTHHARLARALTAPSQLVASPNVPASGPTIDLIAFRVRQPEASRSEE